MIRIIHYRKKCIGCYACVEAHPERWRVSRQDGKSILVGGKSVRDFLTLEVSDDEARENEMAASNCPVKVIRVSDC